MKVISRRAILSRTHENVDKIIAIFLSKLRPSEQIYCSADSFSKIDSDVNWRSRCIEFVNEMSSSCIDVQVNISILLMRNSNPQSEVLETKILTASRTSCMVFIPGTSLTKTSNSGFPFIFNRRQFPVNLSHAIITSLRAKLWDWVGVGFYRNASIYMDSWMSRHRAPGVALAYTLSYATRQIFRGYAMFYWQSGLPICRHPLMVSTINNNNNKWSNWPRPLQEVVEEASKYLRMMVTSEWCGCHNWY